MVHNNNKVIIQVLKVNVVFQIVIPFFSLLIKDIYFLNEGCASRLSSGHINFEVRVKVKPELKLNQS